VLSGQNAITEGSNMLVIFSCPVHANIPLFSEAATQLLKYMGLSGNVPGEILAEDVADALNQLQVSINNNNQSSFVIDPLVTKDTEPVITLNMRAAPLVQLLKKADASKCSVTWESYSK
jgi:hypothetical protein